MFTSLAKKEFASSPENNGGSSIESRWGQAYGKNDLGGRMLVGIRSA
jgi:hypothetical protein